MKEVYIGNVQNIDEEVLKDMKESNVTMNSMHPKKYMQRYICL